MKFIKKNWIAVITTFLVSLPFVSAGFIPGPLENGLRGIFNSFDAVLYQRTMFAILLIAVYYYALSFVFAKGRTSYQPEPRVNMKSIRVVIAIVLAIMSAIFVPAPLLETAFTSFGYLSGILLGLAAVVAFLIIARQVGKDDCHLHHGVMAAAYALSSVVLAALTYTLEPLASFSFGGWFSFKDVIDITLIIFLILAMIHLVRAFTCGRGARQTPEGEGDAPPAQEPETPPAQQQRQAQNQTVNLIINEPPADRVRQYNNQYEPVIAGRIEEGDNNG